MCRVSQVQFLNEELVHEGVMYKFTGITSKPVGQISSLSVAISRYSHLQTQMSCLPEQFELLK